MEKKGSRGRGVVGVLGLEESYIQAIKSGKDIFIVYLGKAYTVMCENQWTSRLLHFRM